MFLLFNIIYKSRRLFVLFGSIRTLWLRKVAFLLGVVYFIENMKSTYGTLHMVSPLLISPIQCQYDQFGWIFNELFIFSIHTRDVFISWITSSVETWVRKSFVLPFYIIGLFEILIISIIYKFSSRLGSQQCIVLTQDSRT